MFDCAFARGRNVLIRVALAILDINRSRILAINDAASLLGFLKDTTNLHFEGALEVWLFNIIYHDLSYWLQKLDCLEQVWLFSHHWGIYWLPEKQGINYHVELDICLCSDVCMTHQGSTSWCLKLRSFEGTRSRASTHTVTQKTIRMTFLSGLLKILTHS